MSILNQSEVFTALDELKDVLDDSLGLWSIPKVIVIGAESVGKSTLLERICMLPIFPEGKDIVTRMPVEVRLRYDAKCDERTATIGVYSRGGENDGKSTMGYDVTANIPIDNNDAKLFVRKWMSRACKIQSENDTVNNAKTIRTDKIIIMEIRGKNMPNLDLLDLPGIVGKENSNENSTVVQDSKCLVESMIDQYKDRAIFLMLMVLVLLVKMKYILFLVVL